MKGYAVGGERNGSERQLFSEYIGGSIRKQSDWGSPGESLAKLQDMSPHGELLG
jgi:hypothetical protein